MEQISQKDVNQAAWAACDTFRGVVDPAQYKDYILVMLFLKYISDVWQDHYNELKKEYGDDDTRIRRKLDRERFVLPVVTLTKTDEETGEKTVEDEFPANFQSLYDRRSAANIGELINITFDHIEEANKAKLEGVFRNIDFHSEANLGKTKDKNRRLSQLLQDFHKPQLDLSPSRVPEDVIGNTYIYLIERFASDAGKKAGEFFTPLKVTELVARLCAPKPGDRICDPACGSGGLLIQAALQVGSRDFALFGQESNGSTWALARMNMFLHSFDSARIEWCDTLNSPMLIEHDRLMKFDCVVANPPFSLDKWGAEDAGTDKYNRFWRGVPPKSKGDWAFISHMIETAQEKEGRVAVVVPHGVLFRGAAEGRIRQKMIEENLLDAVIGLPGNLFPTTSIPVAILIFDRSREKGGKNAKRKDILFIDASSEFSPGKNQNTLTDENLDRIASAHRKRKEVEKYAHLADFDEVKENDFNLNIPRYVDTFEEEEEIDIDAVQKEIDELEKELADVRKEMGGEAERTGQKQVMNLQQLQQELAQGEGMHTEFKRAWAELPRNLFESVCAFLNTDGGMILLGVSDEGEITGVDPDAVGRLKAQLASLSNNPQKIDPPYLLFPHEFEIDGKLIIAAQIPLSSQLHKTGGEIFLRSEDGDYRAQGTHQLAGLINRKLGLFTEQRPLPNLSMSDLRPELFDHARRLMHSYNSKHPWAKLSNEELLHIGGFYAHNEHTGEQKLTLAAVLMFGTDIAIQQAVPAYKFDCLLRRENEDRYDDRVMIYTNLMDAYDQMMDFIEKHLNDPFYLEGDMRMSLRDKIFREAVSNIVSHREYTSPAPARLIIYKDQVILDNPTVQHHFEEITPANLRPFSKNPTLAKFMIQLGRFDELGSGVTNINKYLPLYAHGSKPTFKESPHTFELTIPLGTPDQANPKKGTKWAPSRHQVNILHKCLKESSIGELMAVDGRTDRTKFRNQVLTPLLQENLVEMTQPDSPRSPTQKISPHRNRKKTPGGLMNKYHQTINDHFVEMHEMLSFGSGGKMNRPCFKPAITDCKTRRQAVSDHFVEVHEMIERTADAIFQPLKENENFQAMEAKKWVTSRRWNFSARAFPHPETLFLHIAIGDE